MSEHTKTCRTRRSAYASREAWHAACERRGRFCHFCESRASQSPLCKACQDILARFWEAGDDLGLCTCEVVLEWVLNQFGGREQPPVPVKQHIDDSSTQDEDDLTEIPISLFAQIAESVDNGEAAECIE